MKKTLLGFLAITLSIAQPLMAGSSLEGGEKQRKVEVSHPGQPSMGETPQANPAEATLAADASITDDAASTRSATATKSGAENEVTNEPTDDLAIIGINNHKSHQDVSSVEIIHQKQSAKKLKMKPLKEHRKHAGGGVLGILSFIFGIIGLLIGFTIILWPLALLFGIVAIILGAIGLGVGGSKVFSILGLILGILTILIPVLLFAVILAAVI